MNRSAKDGARSSLHYGGEGVFSPPVVPGCVRAAWYGRQLRDPRRPRIVRKRCTVKGRWINIAGVAVAVHGHPTRISAVSGKVHYKGNRNGHRSNARNRRIE